jgi:phosphatidylserine decarboxylase
MFHKEGFSIIKNTILILITLNWTLFYILNGFNLTFKIFLLFSLVILYLVLQFFRNPKRKTIINGNHIIAPADGKIVVIEEVVEHEYFNEPRLQISIFMSPLNVHVNRNPISGKIKYVKYHPGKFLVAWHPKSSSENERTTIVIENKTTGPILFRQIAGAMARRIVMYSKKNDEATQGKDMGFIKFGSRLDVFVPLDSKIHIHQNQIVRGGETVIASVG